MQRSLLKFENAIKSDATRKSYSGYLNRFLLWSKIKSHDELLSLKDSFLQELLEDYLFFQKKQISPNSLQPMFSALELFFTMNDKTLNFRKIRKMFPARVKKSGDQAWSTENIRKMLEFQKSHRNKALIHFLASTGCRIGAIPGLKMKHISELSDGCKSILFYEGSEVEYYGFLTPEASKFLDGYFEKRIRDGETFTKETPVFRLSYSIGGSKAKPFREDVLRQEMIRVVRTANIQREKQGKRYNIQTDHGFRKRFNTLLKSNDKSNASLVEKLMGHAGVYNLDGTYLKPSNDVLFSEFKKHVQNLTIDPTERLEAEKEELRIELSEKDNLKLDLKNQAEEIKSLKENTEFLLAGMNLNAKMIKTMALHPEFQKKVARVVKYIEKEERIQSRNMKSKS